VRRPRSGRTRATISRQRPGILAGIRPARGRASSTVADLDPRHRLEFLDALREAHARLHPIVLWATHDINEALAIADAVLMLRRGRVVAFGPLAQALTAEALEEAFAIRARIEPDTEGRPRVAFFRP
jgi:iron complex transport system ATP-binding protein